MSTTGRRTFLKMAVLGAAATTVQRTAAGGAADRRVVVGVIGTGGMGTNHVRQLAQRHDVELAYLCDVDR